MGGLGTPKIITNAMKTGVVALITVFNFGFTSGLAPLSHTISAEIPTSRLRDMTYRTASAVNVLVQYASNHLRKRIHEGFANSHNS